MIDDPYREADALPTLRTRNWLLLAIALAGWAIFGAVAWGLWLLGCVAKAAFAAAVAIGWPV
jgi:hypothetical protein